MEGVSEIIVIKSDEREISTVEKFLYNIFINNKLPKENFYRVLLCVSEAIINSIHHGNTKNICEEIVVKIHILNNIMYIEIRDEGEGFDPCSVDDPTEEENIKKESGRGLHIIRSLCDHLEFKDRGRCLNIIIEFK